MLARPWVAQEDIPWPRGPLVAIPRSVALAWYAELPTVQKKTPWRDCINGGKREGAIKKFTTKIHVYWFDCDPAGIMYFANFFKYFEIAEEELFASLGRPRAQIFAEKHIGFPRVETWARFRKPSPHGDRIEVTVWIEKRTEKSLLYCFEVRAEGKPDLLVEGSYWVVCIQRPEFRPIPVPPEVLELLKDYLPPVSRRSREHGERHPHRDVAP